MAKAKKQGFSAVKAVKANARARVGTPPPGAPIPDRRHKAEHGPPKHKESLGDTLARAERTEEEEER